MTVRVNIPQDAPSNLRGLLSGIGTVVGGVVGSVVPGAGTALGASGGGALAGGLAGATAGGAAGALGGGTADVIKNSDQKPAGIGVVGDSAISRRLNNQSFNPMESISDALSVARTLPPILRQEYEAPLEQASERFRTTDQNLQFRQPKFENPYNVTGKKP